MPQRIALIAGSVAATATLTIALAAAGFAPGGPRAAAVPVSAGAEPQATPQVQVDTVYVAPPPAPQTITVHKTVGSGGEREGTESGAGD